MDLTSIGAVAQIVGTAAIIVSLFYLAMQIRHNVQAVRSATYQSIVSHISTVGRLFIDDPELGTLFAKSPEEMSELSPHEQGRFSGAVGFIFRHYDSVYYHYLSGALEEDQWEGFRHRLTEFLTIPAVAHWWPQARGAFSKKFATYVDAELERLAQDKNAV